MGAFDPPTNAHVALAAAAAAQLEIPPVLCLTSVRLARPPDTLLTEDERIRLLEALADDERFGLCIADGGTYLEVAGDLRSSGIDAVFVIGSDKLPQLEDPSFYTEGEAGVAATFRDVRFVVAERAGTPVAATRRIDVLDAFDDPTSATEVRRRVRAGLPVDAMVPPVVAKGLERYTAPG